MFQIYEVDLKYKLDETYFNCGSLIKNHSSGSSITGILELKLGCSSVTWRLVQRGITTVLFPLEKH